MVDRRIAERRRQIREQRRRWRLRRTATVVTLVVLLGLAYAVERSPLVALSEIEVAGVDRLTADEVRAASGLEPGTSTLRLGLDEAERRIERLPLVASADARRSDPLTVVVRVVERMPVAVAQAGKEHRLIDRDGVVIAEGASPGLVRIRLPDEASLPDPGEHVTRLPALGNAHAVLDGLSGPLRARVVRYHAAADDELTLLLEAGVRVRFGRAERVDEKVRALGAVLQDLGDTPVSIIDVRAPGAPVVER